MLGTTDIAVSPTAAIQHTVTWVWRKSWVFWLQIKCVNKFMWACIREVTAVWDFLLLIYILVSFWLYEKLVLWHTQIIPFLYYTSLLSVVLLLPYTQLQQRICRFREKEHYPCYYLLYVVIRSLKCILNLTRKTDWSYEQIILWFWITRILIVVLDLYTFNK